MRKCQQCMKLGVRVDMINTGDYTPSECIRVYTEVYKLSVELEVESSKNRFVHRPIEFINNDSPFGNLQSKTNITGITITDLPKLMPVSKPRSTKPTKAIERLTYTHRRRKSYCLVEDPCLQCLKWLGNMKTKKHIVCEKKPTTQRKKDNPSWWKCNLESRRTSYCPKEDPCVECERILRNISTNAPKPCEQRPK